MFWIKGFFGFFIQPRIKKINLLRKKLTASTYREWSDAAFDLDAIEGNEEWKNQMFSPDYDFELISTRLAMLRDAREMEDLGALVFLLRTSLGRNIGNIGNASLYGHTHIGTKYLIEEFIQEVITVLNILATSNDPSVFASLKERIEFFKGLRKSFGNTAILLSGGATLGLGHIGVLKCLHENHLLPRIFSGSSSGSIFAACKSDL